MIKTTIQQNNRDNIITELLPDLTPLIDVLFILIVFLILCMNISHKAFDINLPEDKNNNLQQSSNENIHNIIIYANKNQYQIDDQIFKDINLFKIKISTLAKNSKIKVFSDKNVTVDNLMEVFILLKTNNFEVADIILK